MVCPLLFFIACYFFLKNLVRVLDLNFSARCGDVLLKLTHLIH